MKHPLNKVFVIFLGILAFGCGQEKKQKESFEYKRTQTEQAEEAVKPADNSSEETAYNLSNKGIGPVTEVTLATDIDQALVTKGEETFKAMCTACHRVGKKFIGPAPNGILERRSPEWIMNMILNPEEMVLNDPDAKQLLIEYNGAPMANQNLTEDQARAVLEYFRTLK